MHYLRDDKGKIETMYGVIGKEPLGSVFRTSYNTFLGQESEVVLMNSSDTAEKIQVSVTRSDGTRLNVSTLQSGTSNSRTSEHLLQPNSQLVLDLSDVEVANNYGVVRITSENRGKIVSWMLRRRGREFVMPVPAR